MGGSKPTQRLHVAAKIVNDDQTIRRDHIAAVLEGARGTYRVLLDLTEKELHAALELEYQTQRRSSVMYRLIARAAALQRTRLLARYMS